WRTAQCLASGEFAQSALCGIALLERFRTSSKRRRTTSNHLRSLVWRPRRLLTVAFKTALSNDFCLFSTGRSHDAQAHIRRAFVRGILLAFGQDPRPLQHWKCAIRHLMSVT